MSELNNIQKWLTSIIVKPGMLTEKIRLADEFYQLKNDKVIRPSAQLSPAKRIEIYARGYILRLLECMEAEYPALSQLLGQELFHTFARAYLVQLPSDSPDLYNLGKNFPAFLKASQPLKTGQGSEQELMFDLPVDLAMFERAISEVSRAKGLENNSSSVPGDQMPYLFNTTTLHASPCLKLLNLQFALADFIRAVYNGKDGNVPDRQDSFVAISRINYRVNF